MKKIVCSLAVLAIAACMLTACGEKPQDPAQPADVTEESVDTKETMAIGTADAGTESTDAETPAAIENNDTPNAADEEEPTDPSEDEAEKTDMEEDKEARSESDNQFDVGKFSFNLPEGWMAFPQTDIFGTPDEDGEYPVDKTAIYVSKDAKDDWDLLTEPAIYIKYYDPSTVVMTSRDWYENAKDIDVKVQGKECTEAYRGESKLIEGYTYEILTFSTDNGQFNVNIPVSIDGEDTGLSVKNNDVQVILESIEAK